MKRKEGKGKFQTPLDLVVKCQNIDIVDVILPAYGVVKVPLCNLPLLYTPCPCAVPIIPLPGLALLGFPSGSGSTPIPYKTEKALFPEPVFHPTTLGYSHWL
jgi:hypothetical protein